MKALIKILTRLSIAAIIPILLLYSCKCKDDPFITSFVFNELTPAATGVINQENGTILVEVPEMTDRTNLSPTVEVADPECHSLSPSSNTPQDFTQSVVYEVTNEVEDTRQYVVTVEPVNPVTTMDITWETKAPLPVDVGWMPAVELDGKIYVIGGGLDETTTTNKMYVYDPESDTWDDTRANLPTVSVAHAAEVVNGKIYVMGGLSDLSSEALDDIQIYDPQTDTWQSGGKMPFRRAACGSCVLDGKIYLIGGVFEQPIDATDDEVIIDDVSVYDPSDGSWTTLAPLPGQRCYLTAEAVNGKIYATGGMTETTGQGSDIHEIYDPATDTWTEGTSMNKGLFGPGSCVIDDKIIYAGGTPILMTAGSASVQVFSVSENKWYNGTQMEFPRFAAPMCAVEGKVYVIGGVVSFYPWADNTNDLTAGHITF